jgi:uncharacterized membrane protein YgcG
MRQRVWISSLAAALLVSTVGAQVPAPKPLEGMATFLSPVGEPYRSEDKLSGAEHWFVATDMDADGKISWAEFQANSDRFFRKLDVNHNGEIEPDEIERYESQIAPEIRVMSTGADWRPSGDDSDSAPKEQYPDRLGAGRYSWIDLPEPIVAMDTNFDRGISLAEFQAATRKRFNALDANHDGFLTRDELPKIGPVRDGRGGGSRRGRGGRGSGGHHGGGGMGSMRGGSFGSSGDAGRGADGMSDTPNN